MIQPPPDWFYQVDAVMKQYGVPTATWAPIAFLESGLDPNAANPNGGATGLFQIYNPPGFDRRDPVLSAQWAAPRMAQAIKNTGSTDPVTVAINSDWPGNINFLPMGVNDPEVQRWLAVWNNNVIPALRDPVSKLNIWINAGDGGAQPGPIDTPPPPPPIVVQPPGESPPHCPPCFFAAFGNGGNDY